MSIEASSFKIYVFKSFGFNITHLLSSISQLKFHVLWICYWEFLFRIHHRYRVLLLDYLPWRVVVWSFAFRMSAEKSLSILPSLVSLFSLPSSLFSLLSSLCSLLASRISLLSSLFSLLSSLFSLLSSLLSLLSSFPASSSFFSSFLLLLVLPFLLLLLLLPLIDTAAREVASCPRYCLRLFTSRC